MDEMKEYIRSMRVIVPLDLERLREANPVAFGVWSLLLFVIDRKPALPKAGTQVEFQPAKDQKMNVYPGCQGATQIWELIINARRHDMNGRTIVICHACLFH
ncbi:hypothetical protein GYMLUDRAFT_88335 [Collybiopsis luxurians FD-317 M1]|uniref:Uncharacterized protein n=1 Tax=Collybiopsis luxurians FD-317 M1 TaxID=944289 RepID=A0A0D0BGD3_9AGAR|nr:hypothetical protein GYMLUDRAFT_88335 [Collybiopsis luxurians FD-317 M1]